MLSGILNLQLKRKKKKKKRKESSIVAIVSKEEMLAFVIFRAVKSENDKMWKVE